jgi:hypothetical protein
VLNDHRGGKLVEELTRRFAEVLEGVNALHENGAITLTLKIMPSKGADDSFEIIPTIKTTVPEPPLPKALFYSDGDGSVVRESPRQGGMFGSDEIESERQRRRDK